MAQLCAAGFRVSVRILARQPREGGESSRNYKSATRRARGSPFDEPRPFSQNWIYGYPPPRERARAYIARNTIGSRECAREEVRIPRGARFRGAQLRFQRGRTSRTGPL